MLLSKANIISALTRLGEFAASDGQHLRLVIVGGAVMTLAYDARDSTKDIDALFLTPPEANQTRKWASLVAAELNLAEDWLNDGAKGFLNGVTRGNQLINSKGIEVWQVAPEQMLAMKLSAWRDDTDINDVKRLLQEFKQSTLEEIWLLLEPYLIRGKEQKARYALEDAWADV
jgi:predicted nucleotidyltransferase